MISKQIFCGTRLIGSLLLVAVGTCGLSSAQGKVVQVGVAPTAFRGFPIAVASAILSPFSKIIQEQTGIQTRMNIGEGIYDVARRLNDDEFQVAILQGYEFAWVKQKHPKLRPLAIAVNGSEHLQAKLVVNVESAAASMTDLRGQELAIPKRCKGHCHMFLQRHCATCGAADPAKLFTLLVNNSGEEALDDVVSKKARAALVDGVELETYAILKPGCFQCLKVIQESEIFPAAALVVRDGALDQPTQNRFYQGLLGSHQSPRGRMLLAVVQLEKFAPVPADYDECINNILKSYPPPGSD